MLWVPSVRPLVTHVAVRELPTPVTADALQPPIELPPSVKFTVPVGLDPVTVAVNVTLAPTVDGLSELMSAVVVGAEPDPLTPHASISIMQGTRLSELVMLTRI